MRVTVVCAPAPREVIEQRVELGAGATARDALAACTQLSGNDWPADVAQGMASGLWRASVWGRACSAMQPLEDGDRLEFCRPLRVDPKVARRERFARQGARSAGLFAKRRPGAKPGY